MQNYVITKYFVVLAFAFGVYSFAGEWGKSLSASGFTPDNQKGLTRVSGVSGRLCQSIVGLNDGCISREMFDMLSMYEKEKLKKCIATEQAANRKFVIEFSDKLDGMRCTKIPLFIRTIDENNQFLYAGRFVCSLSTGSDSLYVQTCRTIPDDNE